MSRGEAQVSRGYYGGMSWRRRINDTPCARCGHTHYGRARPGDGYPIAECGEWLTFINRNGQGFGESMSFAECDCPEWIAPSGKERCFCGRVGLPMNTYLNGIRACSTACAYEGARRTA